MADQQISLAVDPSDWISVTLDSLFDPQGLVASGIGLYNSALLSIAGALIIWLSIRAVVATAQHGQVAGKHSELWIPIRFTIAVGLILPLPPAGLSAGQQLLVGAAKIGSSAGNQVWARVAGDIAKMKPLTLPMPPEAKELAHGLWNIEVCMAIYNNFQRINDQQTGLVGRTVSLIRHDSSDGTILSADGIWPDGTSINAQCGSVKFPKSADPIAEPLNQEHVAATLEMTEAMRPVAQMIPDSVNPGINAPWPTIQFAPLIQRYSERMSAAAGQVVASNNENSESREAFAQEAAKGGWTQAGAWALRVMATSAQITEAMAKVPSTSPPRLDFIVNEAYNYQRLGMGNADNYFVEQMGRRPDANANISAKAMGAGTEDSWLAPFDISRWQKLYDFTAFNRADAAINPLAEISNLGHSMITIASMAVGTYVVITSGSDTVKGVLDAIPVVGHAIGAVAGVAGNALEKTSPAFWSIAALIWISGAGMAYVLPFLPYVYWLLVVARFLLRLMSGVLAAPLWAIAHLELDGEGLGEKTRPGYMLLLDNLVRPMVSVLALLIGLALFVVMTKLFVGTAMIAMRSTLAGHFGGISAILVFSLTLTAILVMLMHVTMRFVIDGADDVLEMAGAAVARQVGGQDHHSQAGAIVALGGAGGVTSSLGRGSGKGGGKGGKGDGDEEGAWKPSGGKMSDNVGRDGGPEGGHEPPKPA